MTRGWVDLKKGGIGVPSGGHRVVERISFLGRESGSLQWVS